jgi:hypothetical protein
MKRSFYRPARGIGKGKLSLGYIHDALLGESWRGRGGVGLLGSVALVPSELEDLYGETPVSWMAFLRVKI